MSDVETILKKLCGTTGLDLGQEGSPGVLDLMCKEAVFTKAAADGAAATTTASTKFYTNPYPFPVRVRRVSLNIDATGITADNANYATIILSKDDGADSAPAAVCSMNTQITGTGNIATDISKVATDPGMYAADRVLAVGANLFFSITKTGSGVVVPPGRLLITLQPA